MSKPDQPHSQSSVSDGGDEWVSTWQTNDKAHGFGWTRETVTFLDDEKDGGIIFQSSDNSLAYEWSGVGHHYLNKFIAGTWRSMKPKNRSAGAFMLYNDDPDGLTRMGFLIGPDKADRHNFGAWLLVKTQSGKSAEDIDAALESLKPALATKMCPGLGDILLHSKGGFLGPLLHDRIRSSAIRCLDNDDYDGAITLAYKSLEGHVRKAARLSSHAMGAGLMKAAFAPETGPLSDGPIAPGAPGDGQPPRARALSEQEYLRDFLLGSVGIRNRFAHHNVFDGNAEPMSVLREAAQCLIVASYLLGVVDKQVAKRSGSGS